MSWLKIFFKNALGFTDGLNGQFLIAHARNSTRLNRLFNSEPLNLFRYRNRTRIGRRRSVRKARLTDIIDPQC
jgi:hypothetical protein